MNNDDDWWFLTFENAFQPSLSICDPHHDLRDQRIVAVCQNVIC
jgi:hypothetical protein